MHYYVDGYNLLFRLAPKKNSLDLNRSAVISSLNRIASQLHLRITLVFDATQQKERLGVARGNYDAIEIVYTENKNADNYILEEVENATAPSQITIVTSDRELAGRAKQLGAQTLSISEFVNWLLRKKNKKKTASSPKVIQDSPSNIERLLKIFEERFKNF